MIARALVGALLSLLALGHRAQPGRISTATTLAFRMIYGDSNIIGAIFCSRPYRKTEVLSRQSTRLPARRRRKEGSQI